MRRSLSRHHCPDYHYRVILRYGDWNSRGNLGNCRIFNPDGESEPSNVIINEDLPISVKDNNLPVRLNIHYDIQNQQIAVINPGDVFRINIFNGQGKLMFSEAVVSEKISIHSLPNGFYIVELLMKNREVQKRKIIKT